MKKNILGVPPLKKFEKTGTDIHPPVDFQILKNRLLWKYLPNAFMSHCKTVKTKPEHPAPLISESDPESFRFPPIVTT